jgi:hypothetical protein
VENVNVAAPALPAIRLAQAAKAIISVFVIGTLLLSLLFTWLRQCSDVAEWKFRKKGTNKNEKNKLG